MDTYKAVRRRIRGDEGVSPVIAVILMVAITVVLAATVYVWVSGFASEDTGPEQASATARGVDLNDDGDVEWIRVTLTKGENAPYDAADVRINGSDESGSKLMPCVNAGATPTPDCDDPFDSGDSWDVGENIWVICSGAGNHVISASVGGTTILDSTVTCDTNSPD